MIAGFDRQLGFKVRDTILSIGTFPAPEVEYTSRSWDDRLLVSPTDGVAGNYFLDDAINFFLPKGKATRWKLDPRILVFRGIPKPLAMAGAVFEILDSRWVLDSRAMAASLVLELHVMVELVILGDSGAVHLYRVLRDEPRQPRTITPARN
jgi:hypothetical protein